MKNDFRPNNRKLNNRNNSLITFANTHIYKMLKEFALLFYMLLISLQLSKVSAKIIFYAIIEVLSFSENARTEQQAPCLSKYFAR